MLGHVQYARYCNKLSDIKMDKLAYDACYQEAVTLVELDAVPYRTYHSPLLDQWDFKEPDR